jgi:hypothetical protein
MNDNKKWIIGCIQSCTNIEQLNVCMILISLFKFKLTKDGSTDSEIRNSEHEIMECYVAKESLLLI